MTAKGWEKLQAAIPELVFIEFDDDAEPIQKWKFVRLRDCGSGNEVVVYENGKSVEITIAGPVDPDAPPQARTVLQNGAIWPGGSADGERFVIGWNPMRAEDSYIQQVSASVIEIMRDGLGMDLERVRYTAGDETGYQPGPWALRDLLTAEQPTERGAPDRCTDWTDFAERLEWVLSTMPGYDIVTVDAPAVVDLGSIQFQQDDGRLEATMITSDTVAGFGDQDLRLRALGWRATEGPGDPYVEWLYGPFCSSAGFIDRRLDPIPHLAVDTFRTVHGVNSPQDLAVRGDEQTVVNGRQAYISRELGIPCLPWGSPDTAATV